MHSLPQVFYKWGPTIVYMTVCPLFFFVFVLVYEPFGLRQYLDMGRDLYSMNLAICFSIALVLEAGLRVAFHFMKNVEHFTWAHYIIWCMGEVLVIALFMSLYLYLMGGRDMPYYSVLLQTVEQCYLIFIIPYVVLTLSFDITAHRRKYFEYKNKSKDYSDDGSLIRFVDIYQRPKLMIAQSAVVLIEAEENYVNIYYIEGGKTKKYVLRATMRSLEAIAEQHSMVRCHRSYFINPQHVKVLRKDTGSLVFAEMDVDDIPSIPVSKKYYEQLSNLL